MLSQAAAGYLTHKAVGELGFGEKNIRRYFRLVEFSDPAECATLIRFPSEISRSAVGSLRLTDDMVVRCRPEVEGGRYFEIISRGNPNPVCKLIADSTQDASVWTAIVQDVLLDQMQRRKAAGLKQPQRQQPGQYPASQSSPRARAATSPAPSVPPVQLTPPALLPAPGTGTGTGTGVGAQAVTPVVTAWQGAVAGPPHATSTELPTADAARVRAEDAPLLSAVPTVPVPPAPLPVPLVVQQAATASPPEQAVRPLSRGLKYVEQGRRSSVVLTGVKSSEDEAWLQSMKSQLPDSGDTHTPGEAEATTPERDAVQQALPPPPPTRGSAVTAMPSARVPSPPLGQPTEADVVPVDTCTPCPPASSTAVVMEQEAVPSLTAEHFPPAPSHVSSLPDPPSLPSPDASEVQEAAGEAGDSTQEGTGTDTASQAADADGSLPSQAVVRADASPAAVPGVREYPQAATLVGVHCVSPASLDTEGGGQAMASGGRLALQLQVDIHAEVEHVSSRGASSAASEPEGGLDVLFVSSATATTGRSGTLGSGTGSVESRGGSSYKRTGQGEVQMATPMPGRSDSQNAEMTVAHAEEHSAVSTTIPKRQVEEAPTQQPEQQQQQQQQVEEAPTQQPEQQLQQQVEEAPTQQPEQQLQQQVEEAPRQQPEQEQEKEAAPLHVTTFTWAYGGSSVCLSSSFNGWSTTTRMVRQEKEGVHTYSTSLPAGVYPYKFIVDWVWMYDPSLPTAPDGTGNINNTVTVGSSLSMHVGMGMGGAAVTEEHSCAVELDGGAPASDSCPLPAFVTPELAAPPSEEHDMGMTREGCPAPSPKEEEEEEGAASVVSLAIDVLQPSAHVPEVQAEERGAVEGEVHEVHDVQVGTGTQELPLSPQPQPRHGTSASPHQRELAAAAMGSIKAVCAGVYPAPTYEELAPILAAVASVISELAGEGAGGAGCTVEDIQETAAEITRVYLSTRSAEEEIKRILQDAALEQSVVVSPVPQPTLASTHPPHPAPAPPALAADIPVVAPHVETSNAAELPVSVEGDQHAHHGGSALHVVSLPAEAPAAAAQRTQQEHAHAEREGDAKGGRAATVHAEQAGMETPKKTVVHHEPTPSSSSSAVRPLTRASLTPLEHLLPSLSPSLPLPRHNQGLSAPSTPEQPGFMSRRTLNVDAVHGSQQPAMGGMGAVQYQLVPLSALSPSSPQARHTAREDVGFPLTLRSGSTGGVTLPRDAVVKGGIKVQTGGAGGRAAVQGERDAKGKSKDGAVTLRLSELQASMRRYNSVTHLESGGSPHK